MFLFLSRASPDLIDGSHGYGHGYGYVYFGQGDGEGKERPSTVTSASVPTFLQEPEILSTLVVLMWGRTTT